MKTIKLFGYSIHVQIYKIKSDNYYIEQLRQRKIKAGTCSYFGCNRLAWENHIKCKYHALKERKNSRLRARKQRARLKHENH